MRTLAIMLVFAGLLPLCGKSQSRVISGSLIDSSEKKVLVNAVVMVLRKADSVMAGFTRSDKAGNFTLKKLSPGKFILVITHPVYADHVEEITVDEPSTFKVGKIFMLQKSQLLQEIIVSNAAPVRIKGDTTEYKADSFYLRPGSTIEDLLKRLPGIQVDKNGKITAQGQAVQKVLVDGEEFFSDDPTIVTQNMLSEVVDKVQVYDKKSDQAKLTGVDDGVKQKTIDLKLKENKKKGYFGKLEAGTDGQQYWKANSMFNAFKDKRKFSVFGNMSNTGGAGGYSNYGGQGLPKGWDGGILYSDKFLNDGVNFNTSYNYGKLNLESRSLTQNKSILPDTVFYNNDNTSNFSSRVTNALFGNFEYQLDTSSMLKINVRAGTTNSNENNNSYSEALDEFGKFVNRSDRKSFSKSNGRNLNTTLYYQKKLNKPGRTVSLNVVQNYYNTNSDGLLNATYDFFDESGAVKKMESTDQKKVNQNTNSGINSRFVYTEPLSKKSILEINYSLNNSLGRSGITTLEKTPAGDAKYDHVIDSLSNSYSLNVFTNTAGINYRYGNAKKFIFSFGGNISKADYKRKDLIADSSITYSYVNLTPQASVSYNFSNGSFTTLSYGGYTKPPSIEQVQPVKDNSNLLNQNIGNPNLKQSFRNTFTVFYTAYSLLRGRSINVNAGYSIISNDFSTINYVDALGRKVSQPVNVNGNQNFNFYGNYSKRLKQNINAGFTLNAGTYRNTNFLNSLKNINKYSNISIGPRISLTGTEKIDITINPRLSWNRSTSSIRPDEPTQYLTQDHYVSVTIVLPFRLNFNTDCNFALRQKSDGFNKNADAIRWNASLEKKLFKKNGIVARLAAFDILNQNIGFQRDATSNFITEKTYDTFRRYVMLSVNWNFNRNGGQ